MDGVACQRPQQGCNMLSGVSRALPGLVAGVGRDLAVAGEGLRVERPLHQPFHAWLWLSWVLPTPVACCPAAWTLCIHAAWLLPGTPCWVDTTGTGPRPGACVTSPRGCARRWAGGLVTGLRVQSIPGWRMGVRCAKKAARQKSGMGWVETRLQYWGAPGYCSAHGFGLVPGDAAVPATHLGPAEGGVPGAGQAAWRQGVLPASA